MKVLFVTGGAIACNVSSGNTFLNLFGELADTELYSLFTRSEVPTINGDGKQSRDFTYIDNVIEANLKACLASHEVAGNAFNIAYGGREYLIDIYYGLTKVLGVDVEPEFRPGQKGRHKALKRRYFKGEEAPRLRSRLQLPRRHQTCYRMV